MKKQEGYTLVELLVVSGILVAVSGIIGGILISTLRSSDTTRTRTQIAQNGNYAMSSMSELVKRSKDITGVWNAGEERPNDFPGCVESVNIQGDTIALLMPEGREVVLACEPETKQIASMSGEMTYFLTNSDLALVDGSCSFTCNQTSRFSAPRIEMKFELGKKDNFTGEVIEGTQELFHTQISSRNFINN